MSKRYYAVESCASCNTVLSSREVMMSNGVCPYCGSVSEGTVVETTKQVHHYEHSDGGGWFGTVLAILCVVGIIVSVLKIIYPK